MQANAGRLLIDPDRIALAGDSAGAHIAAQAGALVTTPGYAEAVGIPPPSPPHSSEVSSWPAARMTCGWPATRAHRLAVSSSRSCCARTRASGASSTTPPSRRGRSPATSAQRSRPRSSPSATTTRCGLTLKPSPTSSAPGGPKPRRSFSRPPAAAGSRVPVRPRHRRRTALPLPAAHIPAAATRSATTVTGHGSRPSARHSSIAPLRRGRDGQLSIQHSYAERRQYARSPFVVTWSGRTGPDELPRPRSGNWVQGTLAGLHGPPGEMPRTCGVLLQEKRKSHPGNAENS